MKKGNTPLRKFNTKLRDELAISLRDMAKDLGVSATFISAIELGDHKVPDDYAKKMSKQYNITGDRLKELIRAIILTNDHIKINVKKLINKNLLEYIVELFYEDVK